MLRSADSGGGPAPRAAWASTAETTSTAARQPAARADRAQLFFFSMATNAFHLLRQLTLMFSAFLLRLRGASQTRSPASTPVPPGTRSGQARLPAVVIGVTGPAASSRSSRSR